MTEAVVNIEECLVRLSSIALEIEKLQQSNVPITTSEVMAQLAHVVEVLREIHRPVEFGMC